MRQKLLILIVIGVAAAYAAVVLRVRPKKETWQGVSTISQLGGVTNAAALPGIFKLLVDDYHSANSHTSITSAIAHELIAEQLRTNEAFLEWATNAVISTVTQFVQNDGIPIYGTASLTSDALKFSKVTALAPVGLHAEVVYDPNPSTEGPLLFIVEGGMHPTIQLVHNIYRTDNYQLYPETIGPLPRKIGQMDWSGATTPLDKGQVDQMARRAFHAMTGLNLDSLNVQTRIEMDKVLNRPAGKIVSAKKVVYPYAVFEYGDSNFVRVPFEGQMAQTSPGRGEFVSLFAAIRKTEAVYELGEKFLGQGTWESNMVKQVNSMNTKQRGEVYRRLFAR